MNRRKRNLPIDNGFHYRWDGEVANSGNVSGTVSKCGSQSVAPVPSAALSLRYATACGEVDAVAARLHAAGLAVTMPRRRVFAVLSERDGAHTAAEVCDLLRGDGSRLGLTSVYRVLHAFALAGLVHVFIGGENRFRMCASAPHGHLVCDRCGRVVEVPADEIRHGRPLDCATRRRQAAFGAIRPFLPVGS